jgi:hypothetical protein
MASGAPHRRKFLRSDEMTIEGYRDDTPDLEARRMRPSRILQALSPEVAPGSDWPAAKAGDLMFSFEDRSEEHFPRVPGATAQMIAFLTQFVEWEPQRSSKTPPVAVHDFAPPDVQWLKVGGRKTCLRPNGNRVERTVYAHMLVGGFRATFAYKSTALDVGERLSRDADKVRVDVDGEVVRVVGAFYQLSSKLDRNDRGETWWAPTFERLAVFGQEGGPSVEQTRVARDIRFEFKLEEEKRKEALAQLSVVRPTPALTRGTTTVTTGIERPRSWADPRPAETVDPKPTAQPQKAAAPALDDSLDDLPFQD